MPTPAQNNHGPGFVFDKHISVGHLLTTVIVVIGLVTGYVRLEEAVSFNRTEIKNISETVTKNYAFQVDQRVRVWNKVNSVDGEIVSVRERIAELKAGQTHMLRQQDRILELLEKSK